MGSDVSFENWSPRDYLRDFYGELQADERHTIRYFVEQMRRAPRGPVLCFGCGPTLHHVFLAVDRMTELCLADYLPRNLEEIRRWKEGDPDAHDWTPFIRYTLFCETGREPSMAEVDERAARVREAISSLVFADAGLTDPLGLSYRGHFATVLSPYCADSATDDKDTWRLYSSNIATLVRPGGLMLTSALRHCRRYKIGPREFPAADISEADLQGFLASAFRPDTVEVVVHEVPEHRAQGYTGIILSRAEKA